MHKPSPGSVNFLLPVLRAGTTSRGWPNSGERLDEERREWFIKNDNFFIE